MIKHTSAPTHTYIYIYIYTRVYRHFDCLDRRESTAATSPQSPPWKLDRCVRSFSVLCAPSLLFPAHVSKRNSGFGCVHTRTHTDDDCVHARVSRAPPRYLADLSVPWAALRGRERDKGEGGGGEGSRRDRERGRSNVYYRIQYRCSW